MKVLPNVGWVNVMPAADAAVDVKINGQNIKFTGNGYHDKVCLRVPVPQDQNDGFDVKINRLTRVFYSELG